MTEPRVLDIDTVKAEILDLEDRRYQAMVDGDFDTFRRYCHPDLVYTHSDGSRDSVASYLEKVESGFYVYHRIDHPTDDVLVSGNTAIVVGEMNASITANGKNKDLVNNCIAVWVRENGSWLLLAYQPTPRPAA